MVAMMTGGKEASIVVRFYCRNSSRVVQTVVGDGIRGKVVHVSRRKRRVLEDLVRDVVGPSIRTTEISLSG
ncbi:hypothetical protein L1987_13188 [Smallanthus sonchifolius]|uniref:Uncharacterized protein n=1 Tax=Smallanthus sonchifolius TaxID=185202 RepID=A0ACB9JG96_9ASTR|nr:hypothetical protein L1987_13188 [Smallanthus sonchifolius]